VIVLGLLADNGMLLRRSLLTPSCKNIGSKITKQREHLLLPNAFSKIKKLFFREHRKQECG
jgi:hypothetical protein